MGIDEDLRRAKELDQAATPGPWVLGARGTICAYDGAHVVVYGNDGYEVEIQDAEFIAESRTLLSVLIADVERYRNAALPEHLAAIQGRHDWTRAEIHASGYSKVGISSPVLDGFCYCYEPKTLTDALIDRAALLDAVRTLTVHAGLADIRIRQLVEQLDHCEGALAEAHTRESITAQECERLTVENVEMVAEIRARLSAQVPE